jgi:type VI secretion system ImpA family protein
MTSRLAAPPPVPLPEIASLLAPISAEKPSGDSLRFDAVYDDIKRMREEDDPTLPQGVWQRELKRANWPGIAELAAEALSTRSKDLQLAVWLTEAWTKMHAFAGLGHGVRLIAALCGAFWETLHPQIEEGSTDARVSPIAWLAGEKFLFTVKCVPITAPAGDDGVAYAWKDWEVSRREPAQTGVLVSASVTPAPFFAALSRDVAAAVAAIDELKAQLTDRLGERDAPSLTPLRTALTEIDEFVARVRQDHPDAEEMPAMELVPQPSDGAPAEGGAYTEARGPIANRAEAYARLREAADYLLRTEPHSPVPYLVRRAITWGNMPLAEVLEQLMQKNSDLATIYMLLGIKPTEIKGR